MTRADTLIDALAEQVRPVAPLASPPWRALKTVGVLVLVAIPSILLFSDLDQLASRYAGREMHLAFEMTAIAATAVLAFLAAFFVAIPGRSRLWLAAPVLPFAAWLVLSGIGCTGDLANIGSSGWQLGESWHCLRFILATSAAVAMPTIWSLSRARPLETLPVALLAGLGIAAAAALLLQFFHPFAITALDLAVHGAAIAIVVGAVALLNRRAFSRG